MKKRESLSYAAPGSLQMGSICPRFPDLKAQAVISSSQVGSVWQWFPPCFHMSVPRCSPVSLEACTRVCKPEAGLSLLPFTVPYKTCMETRGPVHAVNAHGLLGLPVRKTSRTHHSHRMRKGTRKCGSLPPDDPQPTRLTPQPDTYAGGPLHSLLLQQHPLPLHFIQFTPNQKYSC